MTKNKNTIVNYYSLHYHMKECGVKTVIEEIFSSLKHIEKDNKISLSKKFNKRKESNLKFNLNLLYSSKRYKYENSKIKIFDIPELDYSDRVYENFAELNKISNKIKDKILNCLDLSKNCVFHAHNVNLFKNSALGQAIRLLSEELKDNNNFSILLQVHDFAEDNRKDRLKLMQNCCGKNSKMNSTELAFPLNDNIQYLTINSRDKTLLNKIGIPEKKISLFPNCLETEKFMLQTKNIKNLHNKLLCFAKENNYYFDLNRKIISSPIKVIKRKNVIESLLVLNLLNSIKDEWQLLITLEPNSENDVKYCETIKKHVKKYKLPVTIGFGMQLLERNYSEALKNNKNTISDLLKISEVILTTSIQEGFGFTYLEGWLADKKVIGRRIDHIFRDFENNKINLHHFYPKILIRNKDFKDYSTSEQIKLLKKIDYKKLFSRPEIKKLIDFVYSKDNSVILNNKKQIISNYSIENYGINILNIIEEFKFLRDKMSVTNNKEIKNKKLDNSKIIKYFEKSV